MYGPFILKGGEGQRLIPKGAGGVLFRVWPCLIPGGGGVLFPWGTCLFS